MYYLMNDKTLPILCIGKTLFLYKKTPTYWLFSDVWIYIFIRVFIWVYVFCSAYGTNNAKVSGLISVMATHLRVGLVDPCGSFPPERSLRIFCDSVIFHRLFFGFYLHQLKSLLPYLKKGTWKAGAAWANNTSTSNIRGKYPFYITFWK